jgi:CheY-like chemotaxis protein
MTDGEPAERIVLYVEDVESSAQLVDRALRRVPDVRVVMATNGSEARELVQSLPCALVLTDLNLPDVSGAAWVAELVAAVGPRGVPVVVVSADAMAASREAAMAAGATDFLTKPLDLRQLIGVVTHLARTPAPDLPPEPEGPPRALVERYLADATTDLGRLRDALAAGAPGPVASLAHRLKGSSTIFGASEVAAPLDQLEAAAGEGDLDAAGRLVDEAAAALDRFRAQTR